MQVASPMFSGVVALSGITSPLIITAGTDGNNTDMYATQIFQSPPNNVYDTFGTVETTITATNITRIILRFGGLNLIPSTATITSISLQWRVDRITASYGNYSIHKLTSNFVQGQATWNNKSTGIPWATAGGDFNPTPLYTFNGNESLVSSTKIITGGALLTYVQNIVNGTEQNNGFLIKHETESILEVQYRIRSERYGGDDNKPKMIVNFTV
jgi:hypothetical protein